MKKFGRLSFSRLSLKPLDKTKPRPSQPAVCMLYIHPSEGSYVSFGRNVHYTIMWQKKKDEKP